MKGRLSFALLAAVLISSISVHSQNATGIRATFILNAPDLSADSTVYIAGGIEQLGNWHPAKVKMDYKGNQNWSKEIIISKPASVEYKYTLGSWAREAANANGSPLSNFNVKILTHSIIKDSVYFWTKDAGKRVILGQVTGTVKYHRGMKGTGIIDRDVIVWLPPGYEANTSKRYPVIYMQDGQNVFDPATSAFGVDWRIDESCDSLIRNNAIPPVIVVGVYNTAERMKEYTPGEKGIAYMHFIVNKLKPVIDSSYRTMPGREHTIAGGSSAGGIISFMLAWEYPAVFSKAICMSPAFKISSIDYVRVVKESKERKKGLFFYIDNGGVGLESQLQPGIDEMIIELRAKGYVEGKDYVFLIDPAAKHFEAAWAERFPNALQLCLPKK